MELAYIEIEREATRCLNGWVVRPVGAMGTCGFSPIPWEAEWIRLDEAGTQQQALKKAKRLWQRVYPEVEPTCVIDQDGTKRWYANDKLHRVDGPAVEYHDGSFEYHVYGEDITWMFGKNVKIHDVVLQQIAKRYIVLN